MDLCQITRLNEWDIVGSVLSEATVDLGAQIYSASRSLVHRRHASIGAPATPDDCCRVAWTVSQREEFWGGRRRPRLGGQASAGGSIEKSLDYI